MFMSKGCKIYVAIIMSVFVILLLLQLSGTFFLSTVSFSGYRPGRPPYGRLCTPTRPIQPLTSMEDLMSVAWDDNCDKDNRYTQIYQVEKDGVPISLSNNVIKMIKSWMVKDDLVKKMAHQTVVQITNRLTRETTMYNPLRAMRPGSQEKQSVQYVKDIINKTQEDCNFCDAENKTAEEVWGRIRTAHSVTAANLFPTAGPYSGLVLSKNHNLLTLSFVELEDMFHCARDWYSLVRDKDPHLTAPMMIWDTLPKGGASQVHPHFQIWLNRHFHGHHQINLDASLQYRESTGRDYWTDLVQLHMDLGLAVRVGGAIAIVPLTSHKDHEVMIIARNVDRDFIFLLHAVLTMYNQELGVYCRSLGMSWPPLPPTPSNKILPAIARIGSRGDCSSLGSDISALELYSFYVINVNPIVTIRTLQSTVRKLRKNTTIDTRMWPN